MSLLHSKPTIAVAFSGGLDTSWLVAYYAELGHEVLAISVNTGAWSDEEIDALQAHARKLGASDVVSIDGREQLYQEHIAWLIKGNVLRGGVYPLCVGVERVLQARLFASAAKERGAELLVHGSTGAGNDQVRFDVTLRAIAPGVAIEAPIRDMAVTREASAAWLNERGLGPMQRDATVSINRGLWGTTAGGRETHDSWASPSSTSYTTTVDPAQAPTEGRELVISFEAGLPTAIDGVSITGWKVIDALGEIGAAHGVGRGVHLGDTILGIKGRVAFEAPAAAIVLAAHRELEKLTLTSDQRFWKNHLGEVYGQLVHEAKYLDPFARDLEAFIASSQTRVCGEVRVHLRQGNIAVLGVRSAYSLMDVQETAYGEHTSLWSAEDARGFAKIHGNAQWLSARVGESCAS
jgi:argininosuccinate synthase